ncbi:MAG: hypothetical protein IPL65_07910 [Lewinellaceae bacterium]|nr:hypothetical protein [Lewinellaceae bacterium]
MSKLALLLTLPLTLALLQCIKEPEPDPNNNGGGGGNSSTALKGSWSLLGGAQKQLGASCLSGTVLHALAFNQYFRLIYHEINGTNDAVISTPFENDQNISAPDVYADQSGKVLVAFNVFLGSTGVRVYLRDGNNWQTLPDINWPNYNFGNRAVRVVLHNGTPYIAAASADSTYVFRYEAGAWKALGGKAAGRAYYYMDFEKAGNSLYLLGYNITPGYQFDLQEWTGSQWSNAGFVLPDPNAEVIFPNLAGSSNGTILLNYLGYGGSWIWRKTPGANWEKILERDASSDFVYRPAFDTQHPTVWYALRVSHPVQITQALWGIIRFEGAQYKEHLRDQNTIADPTIVFNPIDYRTLSVNARDKKIYIAYTENRNPFPSWFIRFNEE